MPKCAILKVHLKVILIRKKKPRSELRLSKVAMRLDESLNQSLQGDLKKISYMSSNEPSKKLLWSIGSELKDMC